MLALGIATALAAHEYFGRHWGGGPLSFDSMLLAQLIGAAVWVVLVPLALLPIARRWARSPVTRRGVIAHGAAAFALPVLHCAIVAVLFGSYYYGWSPLAYYDVFRDRMHTGYLWGVVIYAGLVVALARRPASEAAGPAPFECGNQAADGFARRLLVRNDGRVDVVAVEQVDWLEADDNHVVLHAGRATHRIRAPLTQLAARLDPHRFARVHRSTVVNLERVKEVQPWFQGELVVILQDATKLTIGRTYRESFLEALER